MVRLVTENGVRLGEHGERSTRAAFAAGGGTAAKPFDDCNVELIAITTASLVHSLVRVGVVRKEQAETVLGEIGSCYEGIAQCAPEEVRQVPPFQIFADRLIGAAALLRGEGERIMGEG